jgi:hypothetical protein
MEDVLLVVAGRYGLAHVGIAGDPGAIARVDTEPFKVGKSAGIVHATGVNPLAE